MSDKPIKPGINKHHNQVEPVKSTRSEIDSFLKQVAVTSSSKAIRGQQKGRQVSGRLLFVMDATASRQPMWDRACQLQSRMFSAADKIGGLAVQLCYYRGQDEFDNTPWLIDTAELSRLMSRVQCLGGYTQIGKALQHALTETRAKHINAVVIVSDAMEEHVDHLAHLAGQLGIMNTPIFAFQEGNDPIVSYAFTQLAHLSGGAFSTFSENSAKELEELLSAVAVYAAGGRKALENFSATGSKNIKLLTQQLKR